jgi:hypothetical protein
MAKRFSDLRAKISPTARAESAKIAAELRGELPLHQQTLVDALSMPGAEDIDFDPPRLRGPLSRPPDLS